MTSQRTPTRIEIHKLKYHWSGRKLRLIPFHILDREEKKIVAQDILTQIYLNGGKDPYRIYAETLATWGIICPHPQHMRRYSKGKTSEYPLVNERTYKCDVCSCICFNEDFQNERRVG